MLAIEKPPFLHALSPTGSELKEIDEGGEGQTFKALLWFECVTFPE